MECSVLFTSIIIIIIIMNLINIINLTLKIKRAILLFERATN